MKVDVHWFYSITICSIGKPGVLLAVAEEARSCRSRSVGAVQRPRRNRRGNGVTTGLVTRTMVKGDG